MNKIPVTKLAKDFKLEVINDNFDENISIDSADVNRPGLELAGFYEYFGYERVQVIGKVEVTYFMTLDMATRKKRADELFKFAFPCAIVSRNLDIPQEIKDAAVKYRRPLFRSKEATTRLIYSLYNYLNDMLAPSITIHGDLVDVYGVGILLLGQSGIGKSETSLELIKRGHRLVADDAVEIKLTDEHTLTGTAPDLIRHYIEIRGIGILDIRTLYGVGAIRQSKDIDLVIQLEPWSEGKFYERVGMDDEYMEMLGVKKPKVTIPVRPGRNLAVIVEVAAMNQRQKDMGYNAAKEFDERLVEKLTQQQKG